LQGGKLTSIDLLKKIEASGLDLHVVKGLDDLIEHDVKVVPNRTRFCKRNVDHVAFPLALDRLTNLGSIPSGIYEQQSDHAFSTYPVLRRRIVVRVKAEIACSC
jgi:hypothetical protein